MFTRVVEITTKSGKSRKVTNTIHEKALSILQKQKGFVDETVVTSETESTRILALSFWKTREDAEQHHREQYFKINEMLSPLLVTAPVNVSSGASVDALWTGAMDFESNAVAAVEAGSVKAGGRRVCNREWHHLQ